MPSRHYRRHIRTNNSVTTPKYIINNDISNILNNTQDTSLLNTIQQYFLNVIDTIISYSDMNIAIQHIHSLINIISSKEDIYLLLDTIENTVLSIICNISNSEPISIIHQRIQYLRELLTVYPDNCDTYTYFSNFIYPIIESITSGIDFTILINNITQIQSLFHNDTQLLHNIHLIQDTILSIIQNISNSEPIGIITERIQYLITLINTMKC